MPIYIYINVFGVFITDSYQPTQDSNQGRSFCFKSE